MCLDAKCTHLHTDEKKNQVSMCRQGNQSLFALEGVVTTPVCVCLMGGD